MLFLVLKESCFVYTCFTGIMKCLFYVLMNGWLFFVYVTDFFVFFNHATHV